MDEAEGSVVPKPTKFLLPIEISGLTINLLPLKIIRDGKREPRHPPNWNNQGFFVQRALAQISTSGFPSHRHPRSPSPDLPGQLL